VKTVLTRAQQQVLQWRQRLIKLPESTFLDLIRNYLGEVRTPFNKQDLLGRLEAYLTQEATQKRVVALLTLADRHLLSAITMLADCSEERLFELVGEGRSYLDFHLHLLNLEDRLLVFREEETNRLHLAPLLAGCLKPWLSASLVIPSLDLDPPARPQALWLDDACLAALFCFLQERTDLISAQGGLKKRAAEDFLTRFAGLRDLIRHPGRPDQDGLPPGIAEAGLDGGQDQADQAADVLKAALLLALAAFRNLGLIKLASGSQAPVYERWLELAGLEPAQRRALLWGAALTPAGMLGDAAGRPDFFNQNRISGFARTLVAWLGTIEPEQSYSREALVTLWGVHANQALPAAEVERIVDGLCLLGIIQPAASGWFVNPAIFDTAPAATEAGQPAPAVLTPAFELNVSGQLPLDVALTLAGCGRLASHHPATGFNLTRQSVQAGFARGVGDQDLIALLEAQTGRGLPQNVRISIEEWYRDFQSVQAWDGITLVVRGPRAAALEHLPDLQPFVLANPSTGVFVLDRLAIGEWRPLLAGAGIPDNALPTVEAVSQHFGSQSFLPPLFSLDLEGLVLRPRPAGAAAAGDTADGAPGPDIIPPEPGMNRQVLIEELQARLAALDLPSDIHEELAKRIGTGLILGPEQLSPATVRLEKGEAGGLDYTAKLRVIEQAIKTKREFLEVTQHAEHGSAYRLLVWPLKLRQVGSELALTAQTVPAGKELSLTVSKILLVRRIRASIFS
jgi:hypothetical protein